MAIETDIEDLTVLTLLTLKFLLFKKISKKILKAKEIVHIKSANQYVNFISKKEVKTMSNESGVKAVETVNPATDKEVETVSYESSVKAVETVNPATDKEVETVSYESSVKAVETVNPATDKEVKTVSYESSVKAVETVNPATDKEVETVSYESSVKAVETVNPATDKEVETVSYESSVKAVETVNPATDKEVEAMSYESGNKIEEESQANENIEREACEIHRADGNHERGKLHFNSASYVSSDGRFYCYDYWDSEYDRMVTMQLEIGKDVSEEILFVLTGADHDENLNNLYQSKLHAPIYSKKAALSQSNCTNSDHEDSAGFVDLIEEIPDSRNNPERILVDDEDPEDPLVAQTRSVVQNDLTQKQQDFFYDHYGMELTCEEIRRNEAEKTGKMVSEQAMFHRKNRILKRVKNQLISYQYQY